VTRRAAFLDRDGVLVVDRHLITSVDQVELFTGAAAAVRRLNDAGFAVVVVSNQPVVARGMVTEAQIERIHRFIAAELKAAGAVIDRFYFCPHHPHATLPAYRVACSCRKPGAGMLREAARNLGLDLSTSYMIGDRVSDVAAGQAAGCTTILVETGMHEQPMIEASQPVSASLEPHHRSADLAAAVAWLLADTEAQR